MAPFPARPLPQSFDTWCRLATEEELLRLLDLVWAALERRGYCVALATRRAPA
jgi:hypothetical protein